MYYSHTHKKKDTKVSPDGHIQNETALHFTLSFQLSLVVNSSLPHVASVITAISPCGSHIKLSHKQFFGLITITLMSKKHISTMRCCLGLFVFNRKGLS